MPCIAHLVNQAVQDGPKALDTPQTLTSNEEIDVGQNVAQELIFYCYGQVLIGGPFNTLWALGESLGPVTFFRKSPWDHKYL